MAAGDAASLKNEDPQEFGEQLRFASQSISRVSKKSFPKLYIGTFAKTFGGVDRVPLELWRFFNCFLREKVSPALGAWIQVSPAQASQTGSQKLAQHGCSWGRYRDW